MAELGDWLVERFRCAIAQEISAAPVETDGGIFSEEE